MPWWKRYSNLPGFHAPEGVPGGDGGGNGDGGGEDPGGAAAATGADWRAGLSEELRASPQIKDYKSLDDLVKGHNAHQAMIGKSIRIPGDMATVEEREAFYAKLGRPAAADKYELKNPDKLPDGFKVPDEFVKSFRETAFKAGLTPAQAQVAYDWQLSQATQAFEASRAQLEQRRTDAKAALQKDWGANWDSHVGHVNRAIKSFFPDNLQEHVLNMAAQNADFAKALAGIGAKMGEDTTVSRGGGGTGGDGASQAQAKIKAVEGDMKHPYWTATHPEHKEAVRQMSEWHTQVAEEAARAAKTAA